MVKKREKGDALRIYRYVYTSGYILEWTNAKQIGPLGPRFRATPGMEEPNLKAKRAFIRKPLGCMPFARHLTVFVR